MATSGLTTFNVTRDDVIKASLRKCGAIAQGDSPTADDLTNCAFALNVLLKRLMTKTYVLWSYKWITVSLTPVATASFTIGSTGVVTPDRELRVVQGWIRDPNGNDTPLQILSRQEYGMLTPKTTPGIPNSIYYDLQLGNGVLYTWPVINVTGYSIILSVQKPLEDISATVGTQNFELAQEWFDPLVWNLAFDIAPEYSVNLQKIQLLESRAMASLEEVANWTREEAPVFFTVNTEGVGAV